MRNLLSALALATALAAPAAFANDPTPQATNPQQTEKTDHSKMAAEEFASLDKNQDGKLTKDEVPAGNPVAAHFAMLDADKDGSLSQAEFAKHHEQMSR